MSGCARVLLWAAACVVGGGSAGNAASPCRLRVGGHVRRHRADLRGGRLPAATPETVPEHNAVVGDLAAKLAPAGGRVASGGARRPPRWPAWAVAPAGLATAVFGVTRDLREHAALALGPPPHRRERLRHRRRRRAPPDRCPVPPSRSGPFAALTGSGVSDSWLVVGFASLPAIGNVAGGLIAEIVDVSDRALSLALRPCHSGAACRATRGRPARRSIRG